MKTSPKKHQLVDKTITIKTNEQNPEPLELIAESIIKIAEGFDKIKNSRLSDRAVLLLLSDTANVPMSTIKKVLIAGENLRRFIKK